MQPSKDVHCYLNSAYLTTERSAAIQAHWLLYLKECEKLQEREKAFSLTAAHNTWTDARAAGHPYHDTHANGPLKQHSTSNATALFYTILYFGVRQTLSDSQRSGMSVPYAISQSRARLVYREWAVSSATGHSHSK